MRKTWARGAGGMAVAVGLLWLAAAAPAGAVDGVIEINQARALEGGVTPGDPGGFPVTLSVPGSYRLTSDLDVFTTSAIRIEAADVAIDLNGFTIRCVSPEIACNSASGIVVIQPAAGTTIHDGTVQGFGGSGIMARSHSLIYRVQSRFNSGVGIIVRGRSLIRDCIIDQNATGIQTFETATSVLDNVITGNTGSGLSGSGGTIYTGNLFRDNNDDGKGPGPQVNPGSATEVGANFCQSNTTCP